MMRRNDATISNKWFDSNIIVFIASETSNIISYSNIMFSFQYQGKRQSALKHAEIILINNSCLLVQVSSSDMIQGASIKTKR